MGKIRKDRCNLAVIPPKTLEKRGFCFSPKEEKKGANQDFLGKEFHCWGGGPNKRPLCQLACPLPELEWHAGSLQCIMGRKWCVAAAAKNGRA